MTLLICPRLWRLSSPGIGVKQIILLPNRRHISPVEARVHTDHAVACGMNCLRHTFASRLVMAGVDLRTVQERMGHKSMQMTIRYAHLAPKHTLAAVEVLGANSPTDSTDTITSTEGVEREVQQAGHAF